MGKKVRYPCYNDGRLFLFCVINSSCSLQLNYYKAYPQLFGSYLGCLYIKNFRGCRGRMVVGFITTYAISAYHHWSCEFESCYGKVYSIQHYVIKFVSDHATGRWFSLGTPVSPTNKTDRHNTTEILLKVALYTITLTLTHDHFPTTFSEEYLFCVFTFFHSPVVPQLFAGLFHVQDKFLLVLSFCFMLWNITLCLITFTVIENWH